MSDKNNPIDETSAAETTPPEGNNELHQLREELDQVKDHALRCAAELDNYRKRASRELNDERRYANIGLLRDLLPVLDNINRATEVAEKSQNAESLLQGFQLVAQQLAAVLKQYHCERIEALGKPFDPNFHHAVAQQPSADVPATTGGAGAVAASNGMATVVVVSAVLVVEVMPAIQAPAEPL